MMNLLNINDFEVSNDILFVLDSLKVNSGNPISKIGLQKVLYLSKVLEPIKNIIISTLEFLTEKRGPYSKEIQNIVDHLSALGFVKLVEFKIVWNKNSIALYSITEVGEQVVRKVKQISEHDEKYWWIDLVTRLSILYSSKPELSNDSEYDGLDRIVRLVYEDPTYKAFKNENNWKYIIDTTCFDEDSTQNLIEFVKKYISDNALLLKKENIRGNAELITIAFFEFYFINYLNMKSSNKSF